MTKGRHIRPYIDLPGTGDSSASPEPGIALLLKILAGMQKQKNRIFLRMITKRAAVRSIYTGLLLLSVFSDLSLFAQKKNAGFELHIRRTTSPVNIDGIIDEPAWQQADKAGDFYMVLPMDTSHANVRTEGRMTYDDNALYLLAGCYDSSPGRYMGESLRRDFSFSEKDNFIFFMDPFED